jgi:hypothetical protein
MKSLRWLLLLALAASPAWSVPNKQISVQELKTLLLSLKDSKKSDPDTATELKKIELSEELTPAAMSALFPLASGPLATEQIYVLEAKSSLLPPPAAEIPTAPAPDAAAQQALLAKASEYVSHTYSQLPHLTATRLTARFQDNVEAIHTYTGANHNLSANDDPLWDQTSLYVRLFKTRTDPVESENGQEKPVVAKEKVNWGPNNMTASLGQPLTLATIIQEATTVGSPHFLRWEIINRRQVAVFAFNVDKKQTHFAIDYCCFPNTDTAGMINYTGATDVSTGGGATGSNFQTFSEWKPFKAATGYSGELFLDSATGIVLRTITEADFKPRDFVHFEKIRTDYGAMPIGGKTLVVPIRTFTLAEVVPNGDSFAAKYAVRHSYITQDYKGYQLAGGAALK